MNSPAALPMPTAVRAVKHATALLIMVLSSYFLGVYTADQTAWGCLAAAAFCAFASIGLLRGVAWGRWMASCIGVLVAFTMPGFVISDGAIERVGLIERIVGYEPEFWVEWLTTMVAVLVVLSPQVVLGLRQGYFRRALW